MNANLVMYNFARMPSAFVHCTISNRCSYINEYQTNRIKSIKQTLWIVIPLIRVADTIQMNGQMIGFVSRYVCAFHISLSHVSDLFCIPYCFELIVTHYASTFCYVVRNKILTELD